METRRWLAVRVYAISHPAGANFKRKIQIYPFNSPSRIRFVLSYRLRTVTSLTQHAFSVIPYTVHSLSAFSGRYQLWFPVHFVFNSMCDRLETVKANVLPGSQPPMPSGTAHSHTGMDTTWGRSSFLGRYSRRQCQIRVRWFLVRMHRDTIQSTTKTWKSFELAFEDNSDTHSIPFPLLAIVLVANSREEVAAVTAYQTKQDMIVYFTKNDVMSIMSTISKP